MRQLTRRYLVAGLVLLAALVGWLTCWRSDRPGRSEVPTIQKASVDIQSLETSGSLGHVQRSAVAEAQVGPDSSDDPGSCTLLVRSLTADTSEPLADVPVRIVRGHARHGRCTDTAGVVTGQGLPAGEATLGVPWGVEVGVE